MAYFQAKYKLPPLKSWISRVSVADNGLSLKYVYDEQGAICAVVKRDTTARVLVFLVG
jgi:hypothetical protein